MKFEKINDLIENDEEYFKQKIMPVLLQGLN